MWHISQNSDEEKEVPEIKETLQGVRGDKRIAVCRNKIC